MDAWLVWLIAAVLLAIGEIATGGFLLAPFAGGALAAVLAAGLGGEAFAQWAAFLVVSIGLLAALRPFSGSQRRQPPLLRTGTAALVGRSATVVEPVSADAGRVRLDGEEWTARAYLEDETFEPGRRVQVVEIRGATALVSD
jgi:membrane protein implicated in regulation of membrane protease activity